jgi:putative metallohydrolase (TIGR04338 family)
VPRDDQRARVYAAEQFVRTLFDRVHEHGNGTVEFFGANITLPPEARFGSVVSVRRYVDEVLAHPSVRSRWPAIEPLAVRARRGVTAAHYEYDGTVATIAVPERAHSPSLRSPRETTWALRELVVLHEIAHHLCRAEPAHGPEFVATFCELTDAVMGPEVGHVLRVTYAKEGVR